MVICSGAEKLCKFKYEYFAELPEYLLSKINKTEMLLDCKIDCPIDGHNFQCQVH